MRRRLLLVVVATTSLVVVAFAVPLGALVSSVARDRALSAAERDLGALGPVLALSPETPAVQDAMARTGAGADGRLTVWLPDGTRLGDPTPDDDQALALARGQRRSFSQNRDGARELYTVVVTGTDNADDVSVARARVPESLLDDGVTTAWAALAGVAVALVAAAALIADRLARSVTRDATGLSATARALASGTADARARPGPTPELADAARALNLLADRIDELRAAERERVADLSHRLRTPLTALRLDAEAAGDPDLVAGVDRLEAAVSDLIHSARRPLRPGLAVETCDLTAVARERATHWSALADDDGRPWTLDVEPDRPAPVRLSSRDAEAAVDALIGNVFAHTAEGSGYAVALRRHDGMVELAVDDAGAGIADPDAALARGVTRAGSTGLGLDIARRSAEVAGGSLAIERSRLGGARVRLVLPIDGEGDTGSRPAGST
ncbi:MAG TPA: HAMP domain-containing sensor histidine kinase [Acidimicrobiales bacterium]